MSFWVSQTSTGGVCVYMWQPNTITEQPTKRALKTATGLSCLNPHVPCWCHLALRWWGNHRAWQRESHLSCDSAVCWNCYILLNVICTYVLLSTHSCIILLNQNLMQHHIPLKKKKLILNIELSMCGISKRTSSDSIVLWHEYRLKQTDTAVWHILYF